MRTIKVYKFTELSNEAKKYAIENWRNEGHEYFWTDEGVITLKEFCKRFDIELNDYNLGYWPYECSINVDTATYDMDTEKMLGIRAWKFLQNNYEKDIEAFRNCKATGYCFDYSIIAPLIDFMHKPDLLISLADVYDACFDNFVRTWCDNVQYQDSDEYIAEHLEANNYEFFEDGKIY